MGRTLQPNHDLLVPKAALPPGVVPRVVQLTGGGGRQVLAGALGPDGLYRFRLPKRHAHALVLGPGASLPLPRSSNPWVAFDLWAPIVGGGLSGLFLALVSTISPAGTPNGPWLAGGFGLGVGLAWGLGGHAVDRAVLGDGLESGDLAYPW